MIDTHTHINCIEEISVEDIIKNALDNGVEKLIVPAAYPTDIEVVKELAQKYENVYGLLGVHPSEVKGWNDDLIDKIKEYSKSSKIVGIGEIGLDYYWDKSFNDLQKEVFIKQIKLANELNFPISVHDKALVMKLRRQGYTYKQIAKELDRTVDSVKHIYRQEMSKHV